MGRTDRRSAAATAALMAGASLGALLFGAPSFAQTTSNNGANTPTQTQPADQAGTVQEVTVTARARTERLLDVPVAANVMNQDRLQRHADISDLQSIATLAPNVRVTQATSGNGASITIRGIGTSSGDGGVSQSVLVDLDGVPISRGRIATAAQFDMSGVEILSGPQSLFFGKNASVGVISINSAPATSQFGGYIKGGYEFTAQDRYVEGAINVPLSDTLFTRFSFYANSNLGFYTNKAMPIASPWVQQTVNRGLTPPITSAGPYFDPPGTILPGAFAPRQSNQDRAFRFQVRWQPNSNFNATFRGTYSYQALQNDNYGAMLCTDGSNHWVDSKVAALAANPNNLASNGIPIATLYPGGMDPSSVGCNTLSFNGDLNNIAAYTARYLPEAIHGNHPFENTPTQLYSLTMNYTLGHVVLTSITSYYAFQETNYSSFGDGFAFYGSTNDEKNQTFTQEFHANSNFAGWLNFSAGVYYENGRRHYESEDVGLTGVHNAVDTSPGALAVQFNFPSLPNIGLNYNNVASDQNNTTSYSLYGVLRLTPIKQLEISGGARYSHDQITGYYGDSWVQAHFAALLTGLTPVNLSASNWSPEITATYHITPNWMAYVAYKTGYKAPGVQNVPFATANTLPVYGSAYYRPEVASGWEAGTKFEFLDHRLQGALTIYDYNYNNLQVQQFDSALVAYKLANANVNSHGVELTGSYAATDHLRFDGDFAWTDSYYTSFLLGACYPTQTVAQGCTKVRGNFVQNDTGRRLPGYSPYVVRLAGTYDHPIAGDWSGSMTVEFQYGSDPALSGTYNPNILDKGEYNIVNLTARLYNTNGLQFSAIVQNLFNQLYITGESDQLGTANGHDFGVGLGAPRTIAVEAQYKF